jgi:phospholipid/cholesterol/gamma-HCH transport system substrate-binding protein
METKLSFAIVGAFVLVLMAAAIGGALWLASGRISQQKYDTYLAFFRDSVSGLNVHAPVKYRGVEVGSVREIALDPADPSQVRLVLDIARGTPIKTDTIATLGVQGLTGIAYVELGGGSRESPPLRATPGQPYPVIRTGPSLLTRLDTAATTLLASLAETSQKVNRILDEPTRIALQRTIADLQEVTHALALRSSQIDAAVVDASRMLRSGAEASAELPRLVERIGRGADAVERMAAEIARAGAAARAAAEAARGAVEGVQRMGAESLPEVEMLVAEMRETTVALGRLARELERNPSALLVGRQPAALGPGE